MTNRKKEKKRKREIDGMQVRSLPVGLVAFTSKIAAKTTTTTTITKKRQKQMMATPIEFVTTTREARWYPDAVDQQSLQSFLKKS